MIEIKARATVSSSQILVFETDGFAPNLDTEKEYRLTIREWRESRSAKQNRLLWTIIRDIDLIQSGRSTEESISEIYKRLIKEARIQTVFFQTIERSREALDKTFRVVEERERRISENGAETVVYECYWGSSHFDTEEMSRFIEATLDMAEKAGINTLRYTDIALLKQMEGL